MGDWVEEEVFVGFLLAVDFVKFCFLFFSRFFFFVDKD